MVYCALLMHNALRARPFNFTASQRSIRRETDISDFGNCCYIST